MGNLVVSLDVYKFIRKSFMKEDSKMDTEMVGADQLIMMEVVK